MNEPELVRRFLDPDADQLLARAPRPRRALFLDRDGVINVDHGHVHAPDTTQWMPGIFALVRAAVQDGYLPIVVTNQAGIAKGYYSEAQFLEYSAWVHEQFRRHELPLLATYYCPHHPDGVEVAYRCACDCRKPKPGMILRAGEDFGLDLTSSTLVGDKDSDMEAALAAGIGNRVKVAADDIAASMQRLSARPASSSHEFQPPEDH